MTYNEFIKKLQDILNEEGIRISQDKLKKIFDAMGNLIVENIGDAENIKIKEFIIFRLVSIPPKRLPTGEWTDEQLSLKIELTNKYKKRIKDYLNKDNEIK